MSITPAGALAATSATFDATSRTGTVILDDGSELAFDEAAFRTSGLRLLRSGQRLRLHLDDRGQVTTMSLG